MGNLTNIDEMIINRILTNKTHQYIKRIIHHDKFRHFFQKYKVICVQKSTSGVLQTNEIKDKRHNIISIYAEKIIC